MIPFGKAFPTFGDLLVRDRQPEAIVDILTRNGYSTAQVTPEQAARRGYNALPGVFELMIPGAQPMNMTFVMTRDNATIARTLMSDSRTPVSGLDIFMSAVVPGFKEDPPPRQQTARWRGWSWWPGSRR